MKTQPFLQLLAAALSLAAAGTRAGQVEADFNDMLTGDTRTRTSSGSPNNGNLNTGSGFLPDNGTTSGGDGEYNNDTGVLQFEAGDLPVPPAVAGFVSSQRASAANPTGIAISHLAGNPLTTGTPPLEQFRMQDRHFASPLLGNTVWFSFLVRLDGPAAAGRVYFNQAAGTTGGSSSTRGDGAFGIAFGGVATPGAFAIMLPVSTTWQIGSLFSSGNDNLYLFDDRDGNGVIEGSEIDHNGNGTIDGVDVGKTNAANVTAHVVIGRVTVDAAAGAADTIDLWLDPANASTAANLGAPTLTATSDEVGAAGIYSVAFAAFRETAPAPTGGPYVSGGKVRIDHFRISDLANAFQFVTGNVEADPKLVVQTTGAPNFNFAGVYGAGVPLASAPRTVVLKNEGATQDIQIQSITFQNGNPAGVFQITQAPALPLTLAPGQSTSITMVASSSVFATAFTDTLKVDTDEDAPFPQDLSLPVAATFLTAGSRVNPNPGFETNQNNWQDDSFTTPGGWPPRVLPGLNGTAAMTRMRGLGDVAAGAPDNFSQPVLTGASNFEFAFLVSPLAKGEFEKYTGTLPGPADRGFQVILQGDSNVPQPANGTEGAWTDEFNNDAAIVNLAYLFDADDLAVWDTDANGGAGAWRLLNLGPLSGSVDTRPAPAIVADTDNDLLDDAWERVYAIDDLTMLSGLGGADYDVDGLTDLQEFQRGLNPLDDDTDNDEILDPDDHNGNGILDPATGDTVNWHLVRVKGSGFGTAGASYTVSVSSPNSTATAKTSGALTWWAQSNGIERTPGGYTFTTKDATSESGDDGNVLATTCWIDEVSYFSVQAPDPGAEVTDLPLIVAHNAATGSGQLTIRNTGFNADLVVSGLGFPPASALSTPQAFPLSIPPNSTATVQIDARRSAVAAPNNAAREIVGIVTNAFPVGTVEKAFTAALTADANALGNWNFETPGSDRVADTDSFAVWNDNNGAIDFGGLVPGSATSARIVASTTMTNSLGATASDFEIRFPFAMLAPGTGSDRLFNVQLRALPEGNSAEEINLRITNSVAANLQLFNGAWTSFGPTFEPGISKDDNNDGDLDDAGDLKSVYTLVLTGKGWGTPAPTFGVKLIAPDGTTELVNAQDLTLVQAFRDQAGAVAAPLGLVYFLSSTSNPRFCIDDVSVKRIVATTGVKVTSFAGGPGGFTLTWDSGGAAVNVQRSTDLIGWTDISTGDADGTHTDAGAPAGQAFYRVVIP